MVASSCSKSCWDFMSDFPFFPVTGRAPRLYR
jgi:hypothetical protein